MTSDNFNKKDEGENLSTLPFKAEIKDNILEISSKNGSTKNRVKAGLYLFEEDDAIDLSMYQSNKYAGMTTAEIKNHDPMTLLVPH